MPWVRDQWIELRPHVKWDLLKALMLALVYPIVQILREMPWDGWVCLILFVFSFIILLLFGRRGSSVTSQNTVQPTVMVKAAEVDMSVKYTNDQFAAIDPRWRDDVEKAIRDQSTKVAAGDERETYLVRIIVVLVVNVMLEEIWNVIFCSQILALQKLNDRGIKRESIFPFYTAAATQWPAVYATYTFEQWLGFMRSQTLIREDGDLINITVKGRQFLKYLLDNQHSAEQRTF